MSVALMPMTWVDFAASVVWHETGVHVDHRTADALLWARTGFPSFWNGEPMQEAERQLRAFLRGIKHCDRCGTEVYRYGLCDDCDSILWQELIAAGHL
jgi:hypothetical protein